MKPEVKQWLTPSRRWLPRSLERQILLLSALCLTAAILGFGYMVAEREIATARDRVSTQIVSLAKNLAVVDAHFLQTNEPEQIEPLTLHIATIDGIYAVLVTNIEGKPISEVVNKNGSWSPRYSEAKIPLPDNAAGSPDTHLESLPFSATQHDFLAGTQGTMVAWQRITGKQQALGWVRISYRLDTFDRIIHDIRLQAASTMALAIAVTLLLLTLLLRPSMRALRRATEFASQLDTRMGSQLQVSRRAREIEDLDNALNVVSMSLMAQHTDLNNQKFALDQHAIVSITDLNGTITYANQRFCDISGYTAEELIGQNHRIVKSGEHPSALFEGLWHTISEGKVWRGDVKNRKKNGSFYWVNATIVPLMDRNGLPHSYIAIRTDISANKELEQHLQTAREQAETATLTKGQFLANMSHEIRTPMNAILGMLRLLQNTDLTRRQLDYASKADGAAQSLLGLINDILDFSKIDAGKMTLEVRAMRLDRLMRDLSVIVSTNVGAKPVEVLFDIDPSVPKALMGDGLRLQQVLINLCSNAIKFTAQGEVVISIRMTARSDTDVSLCFAVRDSGIGIAPENQAHIFEGFSQAEASTTRRFGGTGLGLSISKRLVALMGGELTLASALGQGSTFSFTITLPVAPPVTAIKTGLELPRNLRVLMVDDNPMAREIMAGMASSLGWQADLAADGAQALALVQASTAAGQRPYQAIFMDWQMPNMDGWETIRNMQGKHTDAAAPIVVMVTAHGRETLSQRAPEELAQLHGFLVKPVTASMLYDAVADALASRTKPVAPAASEAPAQPLQGLRLLVIEDNIINQQVAQEMLSNEGALVEVAENGQLGVDAVLHAIAADQPFDAVLMDLQMPVMDGYEATRVLRHDKGLSALPIVAMTANAMASDRDACLAAGMNAHVGKPFNITQLVDLLQSLTKRPSNATMSAQLTGFAVPASAPKPPALPPADSVDVAAALERLGNNTGLYARVLQSYLSDLALQPTLLAAALQQADWAQAVRLLHTLKGLSATVGANYMAALARQYELAIKSRQTALVNPADTQPVALDIADLCQRFEAGVAVTQSVMLRISQSFTSPVAGAPASTPTLTAAGATADLLGVPEVTQLRELLALLNAADMQALAAFEALAQSPTLRKQAPFAAMTSAMANLDFEQAAQDCQQLIDSASSYQ